VIENAKPSQIVSPELSNFGDRAHSLAYQGNPAHLNDFNHLAELAVDPGWFPSGTLVPEGVLRLAKIGGCGEGAMSKFRVGIVVLGVSCLFLVTARSSTAQARGLHIRIGGGPIGIVRSVASLAFRGLHARRAERVRMANLPDETTGALSRADVTRAASGMAGSLRSHKSVAMTQASLPVSRSNRSGRRSC
jgi:hypothetical protein